LRIVESNTQSLVKTLDFVRAVVELMAEAQGSGGEGGDVSMNGFTPMSDYEAKLLLPALVEKCGHNQDKVRNDHREILRRAAGGAYSSSKVSDPLSTLPLILSSPLLSSHTLHFSSPPTHCTSPPLLKV
jgi:hypothetical protein